jgi:hypothetical protein
MLHNLHLLNYKKNYSLDMVREASQQYAPKTKKNSVRFGRALPERSSTSDLPTNFRRTLPILKVKMKMKILSMLIGFITTDKCTKIM